MWKKLIIISLSISVLFVLSAPISSVNAGSRNIKVNWKTTGTIVSLIPLYSPESGAFVDVHSMLNLSAQGPPGPAKITVLSAFGGLGDPNDCPVGYQDHVLFFVKNDTVALFPDNSFLFTSISNNGGILCFGVPGAGTYYKVEVDINGGTGFYNGAFGVLEAEGYALSHSSDGTLDGTIGTITGTISLP